MQEQCGIDRSERQGPDLSSASRREILVLERPRRGIRAVGYHTGNRTEFLIQAGATLVKEIKPSLLPRIRAIRDERWVSGGIASEGAVLRLTRDHVCHSTSSAAALVLGVSANGLHNGARIDDPRS
jgi:hypothetical protein